MQRVKLLIWLTFDGPVPRQTSCIRTERKDSEVNTNITIRIQLKYTCFIYFQLFYFIKLNFPFLTRFFVFHILSLNSIYILILILISVLVKVSAQFLKIHAEFLQMLYKLRKYNEASSIVFHVLSCKVSNSLIQTGKL